MKTKKPLWRLLSFIRPIFDTKPANTPLTNFTGIDISNTGDLIDAAG